MKDSVFKLGGGTTKARLGDPTFGPTRLLYFTSANEPLASLIGNQSDGAKAAADRLMTIPISSDRKLGVLDSVPANYADAATFMEALLSAASQNYGHPMARFISRLVRNRGQDEARLRAEIDGHVAEFRGRAQIDPNNGSARRVAEAFGLVYAAGKLGQRYKVLPKKWACGMAVMACYHLHLGSSKAGLSFTERLRTLSQQSAVKDLGSGRLPKLSSDDIKQGIFRRHGRYGPELLITPQCILEYFPGWKNIRSRDEVTAVLNVEKGRMKIRRQLGEGLPKQRVYSFRIST